MKITHTKIVKRDGEYIVQAYIDNPNPGISRYLRYRDADYFTNDKQDAEETAKAMIGLDRHGLERLPNND